MRRNDSTRATRRCASRILNGNVASRKAPEHELRGSTLRSGYPNDMIAAPKTRSQARIDRAHRHATCALDLALAAHSIGEFSTLAWAASGMPDRGVDEWDCEVYLRRAHCSQERRDVPPGRRREARGGATEGGAAYMRHAIPNQGWLPIFTGKASSAGAGAIPGHAGSRSSERLIHNILPARSVPDPELPPPAGELKSAAAGVQCPHGQGGLS